MELRIEHLSKRYRSGVQALQERLAQHRSGHVRIARPQRRGQV